jgi:general secretion pathway protein A
MYKEFYNFSEAPFEISPNPEFLYMTDTHRGALSSMIAGIEERKGITVVTGEVGTGKTTLVYALLKDYSEKIKTAFIFHTTVNFQDLLRNILIELGEEIVEDHLTSLILQFHRYMKERVARDETVAIVIDEGQNLKVNVIENLFRLFIREAPAAKLIQILLIGHPELETKLDAIELQAFRNRVTTRYRIEPLNEKECPEYIDHRLRVVGSSSIAVFMPEAINRICKFSQGIPRVINHLCDRALLTGYTTSQHVIDDKIVKEALKDLSYLGPPQPLILRKPGFLYATAGVVLATALGFGAFAVLKQDWGDTPPVVVETAVPLKAKTTTKKGKPPAAGPQKVITVKKGWTLTLLSQQHFNGVNPTLLDLIMEHNPQIKDVNRITENEKIRLPVITEGLFLSRVPDRGYSVFLGTFADRQSIEVFRKQAVLRDKTIRIAPRTASRDETWYRASADGFQTQEQALQALRSLKQQGLLPAFAASPG